MVSAAPRPPTQGSQDPDFYPNFGRAVQVLKEDLPEVFQRDLDYSIYREDIQFISPWSKSFGMAAYRRFHFLLRGAVRVTYRSARVELKRIWEPMDPQQSHYQQGIRGADSSDAGPSSSPQPDAPGGRRGDTPTQGHDAQEGKVLHVRWAAYFTSWMPWMQDENVMEGISIYRFDSKARIKEHLITTVQPLETPTSELAKQSPVRMGTPVAVDGGTPPMVM